MRRLLLLPLLALPALAAPNGGERELASLAPADTAVFVEAPGLADIARRGLEHPLARAVLTHERARALLAGAKLEPRTWLAGVDAVLGFAVLPTVAELSADGAALAVAFRSEKPSVLLLLRGVDERRVADRVEKLLALAAERAGHPGAFDLPAERAHDADLWRVGEGVVVARRGALACAANDERYAREALALATGDARAGLASTGAFAAARAARGANELAFAFVDLAAVDTLAEQGRLDDPEGWRGLRRMPREPAVQLLLGPTVAALGGARTAALSLACEGEDLRLALFGLDVDCGPAAGLLPEEGAAFAPAPNGRANAASWILHRDLLELFARRAELFEADELPAFAEALATLAIFFGGGDVSETVIPALAPWGRLIARDVAFEPALRPGIPLPAAALLARVGDPERVGPLFPSAFQTVVGLINVDRAQKGRLPMQLQLELVGDVQVSFAKLLPPKPGEGVDVAYNLEPACAQVGDLIVVGTHRKLVEELVRELVAGRVDARAPAAERLDVSGEALLLALEANREALVMSAVLREGKRRERAERDVDALLAAADLIERLSLEARREGERRFVIELALEVEAAKAAAKD